MAGLLAQFIQQAWKDQDAGRHRTPLLLTYQWRMHFARAYERGGYG